MKRVLLALAIMAIGTLSATAQNTLTKVYNFGEITSIKAGSIYDIEVTKGNSGKITINYDEVFQDKLIVKYVNGKLYLSVDTDKMTSKERRKSVYAMKVYLQMPSIEEIDLSGASELTAKGSFKTKELEIDLSGASHVKGLEISGEELSIDCSGATSLGMSGDFTNVDIETSGASNVKWNGNSNTLEIEASGATGVTIAGNHKHADLETSGASNIKLTGTADYINGVCTGASSIKAQEYTAGNGKIELSGASNAKIKCTGELKVMVSRASSLTHYGNPKIINLNKDTNIKKGD